MGIFMSSPKYATVLRLEGVEQVLRNINVASEKMGRAAERGCIAGAKFLRNESLKLVPVQLGALRSSCYKPKNIGGKGFKADIVIGYTADYAVWVHEDLVAQAPPARAAHGKFFNIKHAAEIAAAKGKAAGTAKGGMFNRGSLEQAKFLEQPLRDKRKEILQIIANAIKQAK